MVVFLLQDTSDFKKFLPHSPELKAQISGHLLPTVCQSVPPSLCLSFCLSILRYSSSCKILEKKLIIIMIINFFSRISHKLATVSKNTLVTFNYQEKTLIQ